MRIRGSGDLWGQIACALRTESRAVVVDGTQLSPGGDIIRCRGRFGANRRFFAKIYLAPFHPVFPRFPAPWEGPACEDVEPRRVCAQIDTEWNWTHRFRALPGGSQIPIPLGKSCQARTIVWEEAQGERLDRIAKWSWLRDRKGEVVGTALHQAGRWLRNLHDASRTGTQTLDLTRAVYNLELRLQGKPIAEQRYIGAAIQILKRYVSALGPRRLQVPLSLTHCDFCMANLLWDVNARSLTVVDFELSHTQPACHDLFALVSDLRSRLLLPWIPVATIRKWEESFWEGYGPVSPEIPGLVGCLALARIFYHYLPRLLTRRQRYGRMAGLSAFTYRTLVERWVIAYRLSLPRELESLMTSRDLGLAKCSPYCAK